MNLEEIRELLRLMKENQLSELEIESPEGRVRLKMAEPGHLGPVFVSPPVASLPTGSGLPHPTLSAPATEPPAGEPAANPTTNPSGVIIRSPIVGMFFRGPSPDKPPFVEAGDEIDENSVLCIIEAMKVMNEIKAETRGTVREILVENGQPVEFSQPLFVIDPL